MVDVKNEEDQFQQRNGAVVGADKGAGGQMEPEQFRKLFIGGLSLNTTDESLHAFYSQFGELVDCIVMRDSATKRSRGFGFVSFSFKAEVDAAMAARPHTIDGKVVDPKRAVPRDQSQKSEQNMSTKRLYVSGVRDEHNEEMFDRYFGEFGPVAKVEIIQDKNTNKTRGFAFVTFDDYDPVDRCVLQKSHMIGGYRCDVKKALSREEMQKAQQKERDRMDRGMRSRGSERGGGRSYGGRGGGSSGGYGGPGGGYGQYGGGGGYGPPAQAWGPPPGPPAWGAGGGYGGYSAAYAQPAPAPWAGGPAAGGTVGPQAAEQGQWSQAGAAGGYSGAWSGAAPAGGAQSTATTDYAAWPAGPQGVPPPQQQWSAGRY